MTLLEVKCLIREMENWVYISDVVVGKSKEHS
jgi:hypothetical protein